MTMRRGVGLAGWDPAQATARLRQLLTEIENGSYVRAGEARKQRISRRSVPRLTLRDLVAEFIAHKRQTLGRQTASDYASRLAPVLQFADKAAHLKRWPLALDIDAEFVRMLRAFLFEYRTTRNGRPGGRLQTLSSRQIVNTMECLRTMFHWATRAENRRLPADWIMPLTPDLIGEPPSKNPLREDKLPLEARAALVHRMDRWQLCQLGLLMLLPLRPDEAAGLIISDINLEKGWFEFGERFAECNYTKARTSFCLPYPDELLPILHACVAGRSEGPLLRGRKAFERGHCAKQVCSAEDLIQMYQAELGRLPKGTVQSEQDRKQIFRRLLRRLGGVSQDRMNEEFKKLLEAERVKNGSTLYTLRSAVTTAMHRAGLPHLELRYLTGHTTSDILNAYTSLDRVGAMRKYFGTIRLLLTAIADRANALGLSSV